MKIWESPPQSYASKPNGIGNLLHTTPDEDRESPPQSYAPKPNDISISTPHNL
jgi:hypothetical protein